MIEKNLRKSFIINSLIAFSIFLLDRISKIYVIYLDKKFVGSEIFSSKYLNINLIWNEGIAFGLLNFENSNLYNLLTLFILIVTLIILYLLIKSKNYEKYFLVMIFGGALGNLYDRFLYKAVPDFIDFHIGNYHWFVFNVADIFITIGVVFMIINQMINNKTDHEKS